VPFAFVHGDSYRLCGRAVVALARDPGCLAAMAVARLAAGGRSLPKLSEDRMGGIDEWLQRLAWLALISLPFILAAGGYLALRRVRYFEEHLEDALHETRTSRLLEILRLIEQPGIREAHAIILIDAAGPEQAGENWWETSSSLHRAAEQVCLSYDYIGGVINFDASTRVGEYFLETWGEDILRVHDILRRYIEFRQKSGAGDYKEFSWLAQEAKIIHRDPPHAEPEHPVRTIIRHLKS
jgi:hypothetical protein